MTREEIEEKVCAHDEESLDSILAHDLAQRQRIEALVSILKEVDELDTHLARVQHRFLTDGHKKRIRAALVSPETKTEKREDA